MARDVSSGSFEASSFSSRLADKNLIKKREIDGVKSLLKRSQRKEVNIFALVCSNVRLWCTLWSFRGWWMREESSTHANDLKNRMFARINRSLFLYA